MTKRDCQMYRRTDDIDPQWLVEYAHKNPGVYCNGTVESIDQLKQDLGSSEWQRMLAAWRKHKQRQSEFLATIKEFHDTCRELNLNPQEVLQVLTAHLWATGGELIQRKIESMRQAYSRDYGPHCGLQSCDPALEMEKSIDEIKKRSPVD